MARNCSSGAGLRIVVLGGDIPPGSGPEFPATVAPLLGPAVSCRDGTTVPAGAGAEADPERECVECDVARYRASRAPAGPAEAKRVRRRRGVSTQPASDRGVIPPSQRPAERDRTLRAVRRGSGLGESSEVGHGIALGSALSRRAGMCRDVREFLRAASTRGMPNSTLNERNAIVFWTPFSDPPRGPLPEWWARYRMRPRLSMETTYNV